MHNKTTSEFEKKSSAEFRAAFSLTAQAKTCKPFLFGCCFSEAVAEFLNASTHIVHRFLCASVERV
jgi:hypothetical protein